ncbi:MAG: class I SAM-dependent methyltransferase [Deltaproteobacteria bacterium]
MILDVERPMGLRAQQVDAYFANPQLYFRGRYIVDLRRELACELLGDLKGNRILDLGCGDGSVSLQFLGKGNQITLVDPSRAMLTLARNSIPAQYTDSVRVVESTAEDLLEEQYDVVICLGLLAHVQSAEGAFRKIAACVRPRGRCLVQITDHDRGIASLVRLFCSMRKLFQPCGRYAANVTTGSQLEQWSRQLHLTCLATKTYSIGVPGAGRVLPQRWLFNYAKLSLDSAAMAPLCSEVLRLFQKTEGAGDG